MLYQHANNVNLAKGKFLENTQKQTTMEWNTRICCSIEMCKEVMDGLRVIFDFSLGANLLYEVEKAQYKKIMSTFHPAGSVKRES